MRQAGKSYKEICQTLGFSKSTVAYHCGEGQKNKTLNRQQTRRKDLVILKKVENFQYDRRIKDRTEDFQRERNQSGVMGTRNITFRWQDVIEKFGWKTTCYLTGRKIDLKESRSYEFDHIESVAKGGQGVIDNLGICCRDANRAKHDMSVKELLNLCKEILEHKGYEVKKNDD